MPIIPLTCPNCGGSLRVDSEKDAAICEYCKKPYIVKDAVFQSYVNNYTTIENLHADVVNVNQGPNVESLMVRATEFFCSGDWERAEEYYNRILDADSTQQEAQRRLRIIQKNKQLSMELEERFNKWAYPASRSIGDPKDRVVLIVDSVQPFERYYVKGLASSLLGFVEGENCELKKGDIIVAIPTHIVSDPFFEYDGIRLRFSLSSSQDEATKKWFEQDISWIPTYEYVPNQSVNALTGPTETAFMSDTSRTSLNNAVRGSISEALESHNETELHLPAPLYSDIYQYTFRFKENPSSAFYNVEEHTLQEMEYCINLINHEFKRSGIKGTVEKDAHTHTDVQKGLFSRREETVIDYYKLIIKIE